MTEKEKSSPPGRVKAHCKNCGPNRWATVLAGHSFHQGDDDSGIWGKTTYRILQCPACDEVFFQTDTIFSEDYEVSSHPITGEPEYELSHTLEHWPPIEKVRRAKPPWFDKLSLIDSDLYSLFSSVYVASDQEIDVLAAIGVRTVFDRASELLGVDPGKNFGEKLSDLMSAGKIGSDDKVILSVLTDAGSAAAHRGWKPTQGQMDTMISIIEGFLYRTFLLGQDAKRLRAKIPRRPKRKKKVQAK